MLGFEEKPTSVDKTTLEPTVAKAVNIQKEFFFMIGSYDFRDKLICFDKEDIKVGEKYFTVDMRIRASGSFFIDTEYAERFVEIEDFYIEEVSPIYSDEEEIFSKYNLSELEEALEDDNKFLKKVENKCYDEIFHY